MVVKVSPASDVYITRFARFSRLLLLPFFTETFNFSRFSRFSRFLFPFLDLSQLVARTRRARLRIGMDKGGELDDAMGVYANSRDQLTDAENDVESKQQLVRKANSNLSLSEKTVSDISKIVSEKLKICIGLAKDRVNRAKRSLDRTEQELVDSENKTKQLKKVLTESQVLFYDTVRFANGLEQNAAEDERNPCSFLPGKQPRNNNANGIRSLLVNRSFHGTSFQGTSFHGTSLADDFCDQDDDEVETQPDNSEDATAAPLFQFKFWHRDEIMDAISVNGGVAEAQENFALLLFVVFLLCEYGYNESVFLGLENLVKSLLCIIGDDVAADSSIVYVVTDIQSDTVLKNLACAVVRAVKTPYHEKHTYKTKQEEEDELLTEYTIIKKEDAALDVFAPTHNCEKYVNGLVRSIFGQ